MNERRDTVRMLVAIAVLAAISYSAAAYFIGRPPVIRDAFAYNASAQRLLNTGVFEYNPDLTATVESATASAFTMPGYTVFLAGIYALLPHTGDIAANILAAQVPVILVQLLLAVGTAVMIAYAGSRLGGMRLGWTAGGMAVAYVPFGMNATVALTETLALALMGAVVVCTVELFRKPTAEKSSRETTWMTAYGVLGGLSILVRPTIALWLLVPLVVWTFARRTDLMRAVRTAVVGLSCIAIVLAPWVVRNAVNLHEFIPLTASASTPLLDSVGGATFTPAEEALMSQAEAAGKDPIRAVAMERLRLKWTISPSGFISWKASVLWEGVTHVTDLPNDILIDLQTSGAPQVSAHAGRGSFLPVKIDGFYAAVATVMDWYHMAILALGLAGLALGWRRPVVWVLASIPMYYALVHTAILFMVRYFYPAMPALILLAAFGVVGALRVISRYMQGDVEAAPSTPEDQQIEPDVG